MAKNRVRPAVVRPQSETKTDLSGLERVQLLENQLARIKTALSRERDKLAPKVTLEEAFQYEPEDTVGDVVKGALAVAFLLDSLSDIGNRSIEGQTAQGLAFALRHYADITRAYLKPAAPQFRLPLAVSHSGGQS